MSGVRREGRGGFVANYEWKPPLGWAPSFYAIGVEL